MIVNNFFSFRPFGVWPLALTIYDRSCIAWLLLSPKIYLRSFLLDVHFEARVVQISDREFDFFATSQWLKRLLHLHRDIAFSIWTQCLKIAKKFDFRYLLSWRWKVATGDLKRWRKEWYDPAKFKNNFLPLVTPPKKFKCNILSNIQTMCATFYENIAHPNRVSRFFPFAIH